jgi:thiol-disulfide isomerase/thioredoxin
MRSKLLVALVTVFITTSTTVVRAADVATPDAAATVSPTAPDPAVVQAALDALLERVTTKLRGGLTTEAALAPELQEFDALLGKYRAHKTDAVAQIAMYRAMLYLQVFEDHAKAENLLNQVVTDFPDTDAAKAVPRMLEQVKEEAESARVLAALVGKPAPELHFKWSSRDGLRSLADLKGKVVVLDFWATWCGPCVGSFPEVRELTAHYEGKPVEVVGVTSLQGEVHGLSSRPINTDGDPAKEYDLMKQFMQRKDVTWTVAFSEEPVFNPAWGVRGIPFMAILAPDGTVRHVGLHPSSPLADKTAKIDALIAEFNLPQKSGG